MNGIEMRWQAWNVRFAVLELREKALIAVAVALVVLFGGYNYWIDPALTEEKQLRGILAQQHDEQASLAEQAASLTTQANDPDAANRDALQRLNAELALTERELENFSQTLISPADVPALLQKLLTRHRGLTLLSLTVLPPRALIDMTEKQEETASTTENLYQHGIEIKVAGSYHDLLAYAAELDASPQRLLRGKLSLVVKHYPISEMTLTVHTLSLDTRWFAV